ncbi:MAG TPA: Maf family protein [Chloroflexia bacterium]|nr:Maf family protein [Chloroflexia bacterium]
MPAAPPRLVLASASPRRKELLTRLTAPFEIIASGAEENPWNQPYRDFPTIKLPAPYDVAPDSNPILWAWRKAQAVVPQATAGGRDALILGADTIVVVDQDVLGKPRDAAEARTMLRRLARRSHMVVSGWALVLARQTAEGPRDVSTARYGYVSSLVQMGDYSENVIDWYIRSREPLDKAGAYAVQGLGVNLVKRVEGCYTAVVGLPLCSIRAALVSLGWPVRAGEIWHADCQGPYCTSPPAGG